VDHSLVFYYLIKTVTAKYYKIFKLLSIGLVFNLITVYLITMSVIPDYTAVNYFTRVNNELERLGK
jgi:hypothetical protein